MLFLASLAGSLYVPRWSHYVNWPITVVVIFGAVFIWEIFVAAPYRMVTRAESIAEKLRRQLDTECAEFSPFRAHVQTDTTGHAMRISIAVKNVGKCTAFDPQLKLLLWTHSLDGPPGVITTTPVNPIFREAPIDTFADIRIRREPEPMFVVLRIVYRPRIDETEFREQLFYYRCDVTNGKYERELFHASGSDREAIIKRLQELGQSIASIPDTGAFYKPSKPPS